MALKSRKSLKYTAVQTLFLYDRFVFDYKIWLQYVLNMTVFTFVPWTRSELFLCLEFFDIFLNIFDNPRLILTPNVVFVSKQLFFSWNSPFRYKNLTIKTFQKIIFFDEVHSKNVQYTIHCNQILLSTSNRKNRWYLIFFA